MASEVETGHGTEFWLGDGTAQNTLVELDELLEIPLPSGASELIDVSHMKTIGNKEYISAPLKDGEEADLVMNYVPGSATDTLLRAAKAEGRARPYKIVLRNGTTTWEVSGFALVRDIVRSNPMLDKRTATVKLKWVGAEIEAAGAAAGNP